MLRAFFCLALPLLFAFQETYAQPAAPTSGGDQIQCVENPVQTLLATATAPPGSSVKWYDALTGGNVVANPSLNAVGTVTYYAASIDDALLTESTTRVAVTLTINPRPGAPSARDQTGCFNNPATPVIAVALPPAGSSVVWYDALTGGNVVTDPSLSTVGSKTFYAASKNDLTNCESFTRTPVTLTMVSANISIQSTRISPAICSSTNGAIDISVTGGKPGYNYFWRGPNDFQSVRQNPINMPAGNYTVEVTDANGCKQTATFTVPSVTQTITVNSSIYQPVCTAKNGEILLNVSGGTRPYNYSWTGPNGFTSDKEDLINLEPGNYSLNITDANGCSYTNSFAVTANQKVLQINETIIDAICTGNDGSITTSVTNGRGNLTYLWSNNATTPDLKNIPAGTYTVNVTDADGCKGSETYIVAASQPNIIIDGGVSKAICTSKTGAININISGGYPGYTSVWTGPNGFTSTTEDISNLIAGDYTIEVTDARGCKKNRTFKVETEQRPFALFPTIVNSVCSGNLGSISLWIFGGTGPYTYLWSNNTTAPKAINLSAGNYTVVVTDAYGCTSTGNYTVGATPSNIVIDGEANRTFCTGKTGSINVNIAFGTTPYTFKWTGPGGYTSTEEDISGLDAGDYTLEVTDKNGCQRSKTFTVLVNTPTLALNSTVVNSKCTGNAGSITLNVTGGTSPYTYKWNNNATTPSITDIPAGSYSVTVTDKNGCTANGNYTVGADPSTLRIDGGANATICTSKSGSININISFGTTPYTYKWTGPNGFSATTEDLTGLDLGDYTVEVTDRNGCKNTKTYKVDQILQTLTITNTVRRPICTENNGVINITVNGGTRPYKYQWTGSNGFSATTEDVTNLPAGTYTVVVSDQFGCSQTQSFTLTVNQQLLFIEGTVKDALCSNNGAIDLDISGGRPVYVFAWTGPNGYTSTDEDPADLAPGDYDLYVFDANGCEEYGTFQVNFTKPVINISYSVTDPTCTVNTGSIKITAPAPAPEITYSIDGTTYTNTTGIFDNLTPGNYNITAKSGDCISDPVTAIVKPALSVPPAPTVAVEHPTCSLNTGKITVSAPSGTGYSYSINGTDYTNTTGIFSPVASGTYNVTVKNADGCISPAIPAIINNALTIPAAPTLALEHPTCSVNTGKITVNTPTPAAGISYSINGTDYSNTNGIFPGLAPGTYNVTVKNSDGCISQATQAIIQKVLVTPNAAEISLDQPTCSVNTGKITVTNPLAAGLSYSIDGTNYTNTTGIFSPVAPGTYNVTVKNADGCISPAKPVIINNALTTPSAPALSLEHPTCSVNTGKITINTPTPAAGLSYSVNGTDYANTDGVFPALAPGTYNVTVKNSDGCISPATPAIVQAPPLTPAAPTLSSEPPVCTSNIGKITITAPTGPGFTYSIDGTNYTNTTGAFTNLAEGNYSVTAKNSSGCISVPTPVTLAKSTATITISELTTESKCGKNNGTIDLTVSGSGIAPLKYSWTGPGGFTAVSEDLNGLAPGDYSIEITDANGCKNNKTIKVAGNNYSITVNATAPDIKCNETTSIITATSNGGLAPYQYSIDGGTLQPGNTFTKGAGTYKVAATDANGCTGEFTIIVKQVPADITLIASAPVLKCNETSTTIIATASKGTSPYQYSIDGGAFQDGNTFSKGVGSYKIVARDVNGCTVETPIVISQVPTDITVTASAPVLKCSETTVTITALGSKGTVPYEYSIDGNTFQPAATFTKGVGNYTITVKDANGCIATTPVAVTQVATDVAVTASAPAMKCSETTVNITAVGTKGTSPYEYSIDGTTFQPAATFTKGVGNYTVTIKDANGCMSTTTVSVTQVPNDISLTASAPDQKCNETSVNITASASKGTAPFDYAIDGGAFQASNIFSKPAGTYKITARDANGCTTDFNITVNKVPNDISVTTFAPDLKCSETTVNINASASKGTAPYQYAIDGGTFQDANIFARGTGTYKISARDANGCIVDAPITIKSIINDVSVTASAPPLKCGQNTVTITVAAQKGTAPYQYAVDGGTFQTANTFARGPGTYKITAKDANGCTNDATLTILPVPADLTVSASAPQIQCGETTALITAIATKGTAPYQYSFDGGITYQSGASLAKDAGTHKVMVKDANDCIAETPVTITPFISDLNATTEITPVRCGKTNGAISVNASGGTGAYSYSLNGGAFQANKNFSNLAAGVYKITVKDANGCTKEINATITTSDSDLSLSATAPDLKCGESLATIIANASNGTGPYQYAIDGGALQTGNTFSRGPGIYTISVEDALGCIVEASITVKSVPADISVTAVAPLMKCDETSVNITATASKGTGPYQYSIDGGTFQNANTFSRGPGSYKITAKDLNGCTADVSVTVSQIVSDVTMTVIAPDLKCNETTTTITATASKGTAPYQFAIDGGPFQAANTFTKGIGTYKITAKDANGCTTELNITVKSIVSDLEATAVVTDTKCGASIGNINITAAKGNAPYSYSLNGGSYQTGNVFSNLGAGNYTITVKDAFGCTKDLTAVVKNEASDLVLNASAPDLKCGENTVVITAMANKGTAPYLYTIDGGTFQAGNTFSKTAGTYKISAKDANGCITDFNITVKAELCCTVELTASAPDVKCGETTTIITATATKGKAPYEYAIDGGAYQTGNTFTKGAGSYKITAKDANGCTADFNITVKAIVSDLEATAAAPDIKCGETNGTITVTASKGTAPYNYSLNGGASQTTNSFSGLAAGSYKITVKDANGCTKDADVTIKQVASDITLNASANDITCGQTTTTITAQATKGTAPYLYAIDGTAYQAGNTFTKGAGSYKISAKDANNCISDFNITVKAIVSDLEATASAPDIKCGETNGTITVTASKGTAPYSYSLNGGAAQTTSTFTNLLAGSYKITVKDGGGCTKDVDVTIKQVASDIAVTASAPDVKCGETTVTITAEATKGTTPYLYAIDGGTFQAGNTFTKGAGTYKISAKDANGCIADFNITVKSEICCTVELTASAPDVKCGETTTIITATATKGKAPYEYAIDGGAFQSGNTFTKGAGSYKITAKDANGCTADFNITVKAIVSDLEATATAPDIKCGETNGTITVTASKGTAPYNYSLNGGASQTTNTFSGLAAGSYKIIVKDANGCNKDVDLTIKQVASDITVGAAVPDIKCGETTAIITATATKGTAPYEYAIDGGIYQTGNTFTKVAGDYKISAKDANGCIADFNITVKTIVSDLDATAVAPDIKCGESNGAITVTATKGTAPYSYSLDGGAVQTANTFSNLAAGSYKITVKDANGCTKLVDVTIKQVASDIAVTASAPDVKCGETTVTITAEATKGTTPYLYAIDGGTFQAGNTFIKGAGTYKISAKDANGCVADFNITVKAELCCTVELTAAATDVKCGETTTIITATATKGTAPYEYAIDGGTYQTGNSFTKGPGSYKVTAKDANGCTADFNITVKAIVSDLEATASAPDIKCGESNGAITVTATKGTAPYSYSLEGGAYQASNIFSNLTAGSYKIKIKDAGGCTKDIDATIKQISSNITLTATGPDVKCGETTTIITANGALGTEPYQYAIDGGAFQTGNTFTRGPGDYKLSAKDANGCIANINISVKAEQCCNILLAVNAPDVPCGQTTTTITATASIGTEPYQYAIDGGTFQTTNTFIKGTGTYKITVKDAKGCITDKTISVIAVVSDLEANASAPDIKCGETNGSITITALKGKSPYTYSLDGGAFQNGNVFSNLPAGSYKITVKDAGGCTKDIDATIKQIASSITLTATAPELKCGETTVNITATASKGADPYQYAIDGGTYQASNIFAKPAGDYKISAKDANGCIADLNITVKSNPADLTATVSTLESTCNGSNGAITVNASKGTLPYSYSLDGGPAQASSSFMLLKAGNYTVTVKDAGGCSIDLNAQVKDNCCVMELALSAPDIQCGQTTTVITADATKGVPPYQFSIDGGPIQAANTFTRAAGTYKISVKDATGCIVEKSITIKPLASDLDASATAPDIKCGQTNGTITVTATKGTSPYTYSLNGGAAQTNNVFTNLGAGVYKIIVQDANGCGKQVDVTLKQTGSNLGASATAPVIPCNSSNGVLTVIVTGGIPPYGYSLDGGTPQAVNIFTGLKTGNYKVTVTDGAGCSVDTYTDIKETCCTTELTATAPDLTCGQSTTTITATATKGTSPYQYAIDGGAFQNSNTFTKGPGTYKISAKDAAGCIVDFNITVKSSSSNIQATASAPDITCGASNGVITVTASSGTTPYSYSLNGGPSQTSNIFTGLKAGNYKITVTDAAGCSADANTAIKETCCTVELTAAAPDVSCGQSTTTITATATKGTTPYQYAIDGGAFQNGNTFTKGPGTYKISVKDATGCIADHNIVVKASLSDLEAKADAPDITCGDTKGTITVIAGKGKTPYSYSINGGAFQASNSFTNLSAGNYALVIRDAGGCQVNLNATLKTSSTPNLVIVDPSEICAPATVDLTAGTITAGSEPGLTFTYWQDAAAIQSIANPKLIDRSGQYYIKAVKSAGCTITKPVKVAINPVPTITMKAPDSICTGLTANIEITHQGTAPWSFQYSDGSQTNFVNNITSQQYTLRVNPNQVTTYTITSVSDRFCTNRAPQNNRVTINVSRPIPGVRLNAVLASANRSTALKGRNIPGYTYNWEPAVGLNNYTSPTPSYNYNQQVDYRIRMTSSAGCTTVDTVLVKLVNASNPAVSADFFLPNAFSPNGDGRNDLFFPFAVNIKELKYFRIFNRWGELVFETKTFGEGWNGIYKGLKQSADSYFWTIEGITEEGKTLNKYGNVLLLK